MTDQGPRPNARRAAPIVLPMAAAGLLSVGALVVLSNGGIGTIAVLAMTSAIVAVTAAVGDVPTLAMTLLVAEFTAIGFTRKPYAQLRGGPVAWHAGVTLIAVAAVAYAVSSGVRHVQVTRQRTLEGVYTRGRGHALAELDAAIGLRRRWTAAGFAVAALPLLTLGLVNARKDLSLADDLLLYLLVVVAVSVVGGFWPAVATAAASGLLLNWYLTPPAPHPDDRPAAEPAGAPAVHRGRGQRQQHRPSGRQTGQRGRAQLRGRCRTARPRAEGARRRRLPRVSARPAHLHLGLPGGAARERLRSLDRGGRQRRDR